MERGSRATASATIAGDAAHSRTRETRCPLARDAREKDDFGVVLLLILLTIISFAAAIGAIGQLVSVALSGGTLLFVLHTAGAHRRAFRFVGGRRHARRPRARPSPWSSGEDVGRTTAGLVGLLLAIVAPVVILRRIVTARPSPSGSSSGPWPSTCCSGSPTPTCSR